MFSKLHFPHHLSWYTGVIWNIINLTFKGGVSTCFFQCGKLSQSYWIDLLQKTNLGKGRSTPKGIYFWSPGYSSGGYSFDVLLGSDDIALSFKKSSIPFSCIEPLLDCTPHFNWSISAVPLWLFWRWVYMPFLFIHFIFVSCSNDAMNWRVLHKAWHKGDME